LVSGYAKLLASLYSPEAYYRRSTAVVERLGARAHKAPLHGKDVAIAIRSLFTLGVQSPRRALFWPLLARALPRGTHVIRAAIACAIRGEHMIRYTEEIVQARLDAALAEINREMDGAAQPEVTGATKAARRSLPIVGARDDEDLVLTTN
jgi:hypothetical protein